MKKVNVKDILDFLDREKIAYKLRGSAVGVVDGYSMLNKYHVGSVTWIKNHNINYDISTRIRFCVAPMEMEVNADTLINTNCPKMVFFEILNEFFTDKQTAEICPTSIVETMRIGRNVSIGHHCYICKDAVIGNNVVIKNNVCIECKTVIGDGAIIASGVMIGTDGFGYYYDAEGKNKKVPHLGGVVIQDNVEIGANTCIDRGTIGDTYIGSNVKIDNLCHIAHNVSIGNNVTVAALSMLAGSCKVEENVKIAPGALIKNQITIKANGFIGLGAVSLCDVESGEVVAGVPARTLRKRRADD